MSDRPHVDAARRYEAAVRAGRISACRTVRQACERSFNDRRADRAGGFPYHFKSDLAEQVCRFLELFPHTKGAWAAKREPFRLQPWQCFIVCEIFGWVHRADRQKGKRRFRKALIMVPRKSGKSQLAALIGLYMFAADGESGAEVYSGATSEKQAWEVFRPALLMAKASPEFLDQFGVETFKQSMAIPGTAARFEPLIGKPGDGASPSCAIVDEYHEHDTDDLVQTMITGMGAREQPLLLIISTAGSNMAGPCYAMVKEAEMVLDGLVDDPELFFIAYGLDKDDDWTDPAMLAKANPNMGVSVSEEFLLARHRDAIQSARQQGVYQTKHLNRWVGARSAFFDVPKWMACRAGIVPEQFRGARAWLGLDLASTVDINALIALIRDGDGYAMFGRFYLPEAAVERGDAQHYQAWQREGRLIVTPGEIVDMERIRDDILDLAGLFQVADMGYDPFQATMLVTALGKEGVPCVEVRPTVLNFSQPMKHLDGLIRAGRIQHDGCPVMTWMMGNVTALTDAKDNVYPRKERPENKIDGPIALITALARALASAEKPSLSGEMIQALFG